MQQEEKRYSLLKSFKASMMHVTETCERQHLNKIAGWYIIHQMVVLNLWQLIHKVDNWQCTVCETMCTLWHISFPHFFLTSISCLCISVHPSTWVLQQYNILQGDSLRGGPEQPWPTVCLPSSCHFYNCCNPSCHAGCNICKRGVLCQPVFPSRE